MITSHNDLAGLYLQIDQMAGGGGPWGVLSQDVAGVAQGFRV